MCNAVKGSISNANDDQNEIFLTNALQLNVRDLANTYTSITYTFTVPHEPWKYEY